MSEPEQFGFRPPKPGHQQAEVCAQRQQIGSRMAERDVLIVYATLDLRECTRITAFILGAA